VHGPHLPLGADCLEGQGLAERTVRHLPDAHKQRTFLKLPFVWAAADPVPQPGSISFRPSTTRAFLVDMGRSLANQGFRHVIVSNFHGSPRHFMAIEQACHEVSEAKRINMVPIFSLMVSRLNGGGSELGTVLGHLPGVTAEDFDGDTHGGLVETSQLLALHPDLVDPDYKDLPKRTTDIWLAEQGRSRPQMEHQSRLSAIPNMLRSFKEGIRYFTRETYTGQPGKASAELGEQILDTLAAQTAEALVEILEGRLPRDQWHSPIWGLRHIFTHPAAVRFFDALLDTPKTV
jgi:creatinine amidohydrolase